jgi:biotin synthase
MQRHELVDWLTCEDAAPLLAAADRVRAEVHGDGVHLRAIVELSSFCRCDCHYCGLRAGNHALPRFRLGDDEALASALAAARAFGTVVLQAGEDQALDQERVSNLVRGLRAAGSTALTLSLGDRPRATLAAWRQAGADRYLLKFETGNPELHRRLRGGRPLEDRLATLEHLRGLGYQIGSGNLVGLPGQTVEDLADDLLLMQRLDLDMVSIGPFLPHPATPLAGPQAPRLLDLTLRCMALARLLMPRSHIPSTTALGTLVAGGRELGLAAGANVLMQIATPVVHRRLYEIFPGRPHTDEPVERSIAGLRARLAAMCRFPAPGRGDALPHPAAGRLET